MKGVRMKHPTLSSRRWGSALRMAACFLLPLLGTGCATSGLVRLDRSLGSVAAGFVEFRIDEKATFSIMREPVTVYVTREGEKDSLGFVGSDVKWAPAGYVHQLCVKESPGKRTYGYKYQTMGKDLVSVPILAPSSTGVGVAFFGLEHCQGTVTIDVQPNQTTPVTFSLGPNEVKGTLISKRLDPSQFKVETGKPYDGDPKNIQK
jgi:hypothetical protein